ncbi:hypothetical protein D3C86_1032770 [compost metagenome]
MLLTDLLPDRLGGLLTRPGAFAHCTGGVRDLAQRFSRLPDPAFVQLLNRRGRSSQTGLSLLGPLSRKRSRRHDCRLGLFAHGLGVFARVGRTFLGGVLRGDLRLFVLGQRLTARGRHLFEFAGRSSALAEALVQQIDAGRESRDSNQCGAQGVGGDCGGKSACSAGRQHCGAAHTELASLQGCQRHLIANVLGGGSQSCRRRGGEGQQIAATDNSGQATNYVRDHVQIVRQQDDALSHPLCG